MYTMFVVDKTNKYNLKGLQVLISFKHQIASQILHALRQKRIKTRIYTNLTSNIFVLPQNVVIILLNVKAYSYHKLQG